MSSIPTLTTDRLVLRSPTMADLPAYTAFMASTRSQFIGGPFDAKAAWLSFCQDIACWHLFGHGALMIYLRSSARCIGQVGINHGLLFPEKELGWLLYEGHEGNGFAVEAAAALRDWAFAHLRLPTLVSYVDPHNTASIAVAQRLGAQRDAQAPRQDPEDIVFRHSRPG